MRIGIVEDERPSRSELKHLILELYPECSIEEAETGEEGISLVKDKPLDGIFIDIHLGGMTGIEVAKQIKLLSPKLPIVFATAYENYALSAFELDVFDYIMKPFDLTRIERVLHKIVQSMQHHPRHKMDKLSIWAGKKVIMVEKSSISYIEVYEGICKIHTNKGCFSTAQSLKSLEERLQTHSFFRIHKSYVINLDYITEIEPWFNNTYCVKLKGEEESLPVSRKQIKLLKHYLNF